MPMNTESWQVYKCKQKADDNCNWKLLAQLQLATPCSNDCLANRWHYTIFTSSHFHISTFPHFHISTLCITTSTLAHYHSIVHQIFLCACFPQFFSDFCRVTCSSFSVIFFPFALNSSALGSGATSSSFVAYQVV